MNAGFRAEASKAAGGCRLLRIRDVDDSVFLLRLERNGLLYQPGQHVTVGIRGTPDRREYTVYSPPEEDCLELLIKDIDGGDVSEQLHRCRSGDELDVAGPFGQFVIPPGRRSSRFLFVATGTGIAPFHCFVKSYRDLDYRLLHGVRYPQQLYGRESFHRQRHIGCLSRSLEGGFPGRVTDYLRRNPVDAESYCYLCGSAEMIYEVFAILQSYGVGRERVFTEVYF